MQAAGVDRRSCSLVHGKNRVVKASGCFQADEKLQAVQDPGDPQMVMVVARKPPFGASVEVEHALRCFCQGIRTLSIIVILSL